MQTIQRLVALAAAILVCQSAVARWENLYDSAALAAAARVYGANLQGTWAEDLVAKLPPQDRQAMSGVRLQSPLIGANRHPFDYYAQPAQGIVVIPIQSVKFLDDLAIAHAWMLNRNCPDTAISDYVGLLRYGNVEAMPGGRLPAPSLALGVPANALENAWVNDVSGKFLKSIVYFLMAHEAGHVRHNHRPYSEITGEQAQAQELQSDRFALDIMERIGLTPQALAFFFMTTSRFEPMPGDFASIDEYRAYRQQVATHPLSADRLTAIADRMETRAPEFAKSEMQRQKAEQIVRAAGADIRRIGASLGDPKLREYQRYRGQRVELQALRNVCK